MLSLHEVAGSHGHVVAQVVEAEFVVGAVSDVALVGATALWGIRLVLVDAVDRSTVEHVERPHPLGVALGQVVVDGHHMHAAARERAEEHGEGGHEGLAFTCGHLGDFALSQDDAADELHVVVRHVPLEVVAAGHPVVLPYGLVALD